MIRVLHEEPAFGEMFTTFPLTRARAVLKRTWSKRLAQTLLLLANFGKDNVPEPIVPKISQDTLADIVGTTRSRVSSFMNKFRKLGFIDYNGELKVNSALLNVILHD